LCRDYQYGKTDSPFLDPAQDLWTSRAPEDRNDDNGLQWQYLSTITPDDRLVVAAVPTRQSFNSEAIRQTRGTATIPQVCVLVQLTIRRERQTYQTRAGPKRINDFSENLHRQITRARPTNLETQDGYAKVTLIPTYDGGISKTVGFEKHWYEVFKATLSVCG
jgi:hypothetical protein